MVKVSIHEAKTHLSRLLKRVLCGEEIVIAKGDHPIARLVPFSPPQRRELGRDQGLFTVPENFNDPLPEDVLKSFQG
jgi:prevent-host-death family protein